MKDRFLSKIKVAFFFFNCKIINNCKIIAMNLKKVVGSLLWEVKLSTFAMNLINLLQI